MTQHQRRIHQVTNLAKLAGWDYLSGIVARVWIWKHIYRPRVRSFFKRALRPS